MEMEETLAPAPPQVSVLIVSYNSEGPLRRCLASLDGSQDREKFEVLVVDSGSEDESPHLDAEFPNTTYLRLPRNFGLTKALNIGMRTAKGEFIFFLDPNMEVFPDTVASLGAKLAAQADAVAVCPLLVTPEGKPAPEVYALPERAAIGAAVRAGDWEPKSGLDLSAESVPIQLHSLAGLMVRSYFLRGLRYIDERYGNSWMEVEICFQIVRASRKILLLPGIRAVRHPESARLFPEAAGVQALLAADWVLGAARYATKRFGFAAGLKVRVAAVFCALGQALLALLRLRDVGYHFCRFSYVLSGQKLDGTQKGL
jgi:GT2 family glycosyltransferase